MKQEEYIPNFRGQVELVFEYHRLLKNVRWVHAVAHRQLLTAAFGHFHAAADIMEAAEALKLKEDKGALHWKSYQHMCQLREDLRTLLIAHGYEHRWFIRHDGKVGLDTLGNVYPGIPICYDEILLTYDHCETMRLPIPVRLGGKCALIIPGTFGKELTPFEYDLLFREPFSYDGLYIAVKDGKCGIIDGHTGRTVVPCEMDHIYERYMTAGLRIVEKDGRYGFFDGFKLAEPVWAAEDISMSEGPVEVRRDGNWGWLDRDGHFTLDRDKASFENLDEED